MGVVDSNSPKVRDFDQSITLSLKFPDLDG